MTQKANISTVGLDSEESYAESEGLDQEEEEDEGMADHEDAEDDSDDDRPDDGTAGGVRASKSAAPKAAELRSRTEPDEEPAKRQRQEPESKRRSTAPYNTDEAVQGTTQPG